MTRKRISILLMAIISIYGCVQNNNTPGDHRLPPAPPAVDWDLVQAPLPAGPAGAATSPSSAEKTWPRFVMNAKLRRLEV
jgi:hypothetical protein